MDLSRYINEIFFQFTLSLTQLVIVHHAVKMDLDKYHYTFTNQCFRVLLGFLWKYGIWINSTTYCSFSAPVYCTYQISSFWFNNQHFEEKIWLWLEHWRKFFLKKIRIHSMQHRTATRKHRVTRKRNRKRLRHTGNLFRKNLQIKDVC